MEQTRRRAQWGWYLYDFGNSAYAAVILLEVYSAYFQKSVVGPARDSLSRYTHWSADPPCRPGRTQ